MHRKRATRREFLQTAGAATGALAAAAARTSVRAQSAGKRKYVIGLIGCGGRGVFLMDYILRHGEVDVRYVCDVDSRRLGPAVAAVEKVQGRQPAAVREYREILDDGDVHAVFVCTPDHWHALPTIHACQAGKDVYVEKPASHNVWEGRQMVKAARKYGRIVQLGTQTRSGEYSKAAAEYIQSGKLGHVFLVRVLNMKEWPSLGHKEDSPQPEGLDYDRWLGPAPLRAFNANHFHYTWHLWWNYSGGDIINDGVHQIDAARMLIGKEFPRSVHSTGGRFERDDDGDCPNTQIATWDFGDLAMVFEMTLNTPYMEKFAWELRDGDTYPDWTFDGMSIQVFGSKGMMFFERHGGGWQVFTEGRKKVAEMNDRHPHIAHIRNFFDCVESRKKPNADIEEGHRSTTLCQLANISYRLGGRKLEWDGVKEEFPRDQEASQMLRRVYRPPYVVPDEV